MKIIEKDFEKKFIDAIIQIRKQMDIDKLVCGECFIKFTDRSIEVISPDRVMLKVDKEVKE